MCPHEDLVKKFLSLHFQRTAILCIILLVPSHRLQLKHRSVSIGKEIFVYYPIEPLRPFLDNTLEIYR